MRASFPVKGRQNMPSDWRVRRLKRLRSVSRRPVVIGADTIVVPAR